MLILALDTTTRAGSAAIVRDGIVVREHIGDSSLTHGQRLPSDLMRLLDSTRSISSRSRRVRGRSPACASASPRSRGWHSRAANAWCRCRSSTRWRGPRICRRCAMPQVHPVTITSPRGWTRNAGKCSPPFTIHRRASRSSRRHQRRHPPRSTPGRTRSRGERESLARSRTHEPTRRWCRTRWCPSTSGVPTPSSRGRADSADEPRR